MITVLACSLSLTTSQSVRMMVAFWIGAVCLALAAWQKNRWEEGNIQRTEGSSAAQSTSDVTTLRS